MILYESDAEFGEALHDLIGIDVNDVADIIEKIDVDTLTDLVDACAQGDAEEAKRIVDAFIEPKQTNSRERHDTTVDEDAAADNKVFNLGDPVIVRGGVGGLGGKNATVVEPSATGELDEDDGKEATIKIPSAPGNTVGVMINGELKMVDKKLVHKVSESVLGMTRMPGLNPAQDSELKRIAELAGLAPAPMDVPPARPEMGLPALPAPGMGDDMDAGMGADDMGGDDMGGDDMGSSLPVADASMAPPMPALPAPEEDDSATLDAAISDIESLIPNVKLSEFKSLVKRLEALVSMAKSAGSAALTESRLRKNAGLKEDVDFDRLVAGVKAARRADDRVWSGKEPNMSDDDREIARQERLKVLAMGKGKDEVTEGPLNFGVGKNFSATTKPKAFDGEQAKVKKPDTLQSRIAAMATNRRQGKIGEDKIGDRKTKEPKTDDKGRKTLMDYLNEADDDATTLGNDRQSAMKAVQARLGPAASPQQASSAFDAMFATGDIKQNNGRFQMPAMSDEDFRTKVAQIGPSNTASNGSSQQSDAPSDDQGQNAQNNPNAQPQQQSNGQPGSGGGNQPNQPQQARQ